MSARRLHRSKLIPVLLWLLLAAAAGGPLRVAAQVTNCTSQANLVDQIAQTNYVVFECPGTITFTNQILISGEVIIDAGDNNVILNGANGTRMFYVLPGGSLTLINLVLTGGKAVRLGGAIRNEGAFIATNCVFAGNNAVGANGINGVDGKDDGFRPTDGGDGEQGASGLGGAIWSNSGLILHHCTFATNAATGGNGGKGGKGGNAINGAFNAGDGGDGAPGGVGRGGAVYSSGTATIFECVFHKNTVKGGSGGDFGAAGTGGIAGKPGHGGAGNFATGAAVYNASELSVGSCTFSENRADAGDSAANAGEDTSGDGNAGLSGGEAWGGGIASISSCWVTNSTFSTNRVFGGKGGKGADASVRGGRGGNGGTAYGGNFFNSGAEGFLLNCTLAGGAALGGTNAVGGTGSTAGGAGTPGGNRGGNIARTGGTLSMKNTIVCRPGAGANGNGGVFDLGYNISSDASIALNHTGSHVNTLPRMGGLEDNDGFGRTFALLADSIAIEGGDPSDDSPETDQRGFPIYGLYRDIGAYEFAASSITVTVTDVDGVAIGGVTVVVSGVATNSTATNGAGIGTVSFPPLPAGDYTVTPSHPLYTFDPPSETVTLGRQADLTFTALRTFSIGGFILDGGNPVNNVTVSVGSKQATTDTNGFYKVSALDAGSYTVQPASAGYAFSPSLQQVNLQSDNTNVNFTAVGMFSISGRIRTEAGLALSNVVVRAGTRTANTGPSGDYTITQLPQRSMAVTPLLAGYSFNPPAATLTPTTDENGIDFTAYPSFQVSGTVLNSSNSLGANAVTLTLSTNTTQANPPPPVILLSDTNGIFTFTNLRAGNYIVTPSKPGNAFAPPTNAITIGPNVILSYQMYPAFSMAGRVTAAGIGLSNVAVVVNTNGPAGRVQVASNITSTLGTYSFNTLPSGTYELVPSLSGYDFTPTNRVVALAGNSNGLDFASSGVYSIAGQVLQGADGLANVTVRSTPGNALAITGLDGRYTLANLPPGTYTITPDDPRFGFLPSSTVITVAPSRTNVNFSAVDVYTINGEVLEGAFPLAGVRVSAGGVTNITSPLGRYTLSRVPAGSNVLVTASMPGYEFIPAQQSILLNNTKNGVNFSARGLSAITGRVIDAVRSSGVENVIISVAGRYQTNTSRNGTYVLTNVGPGLLSVVPSATNRGFNPVSTNITVATNSVATNIDFVSFQASKLFGRITDGSTNPIANVTLRVEGPFGTNSAISTVFTDTNGNYVFPSLRNGFYTLTASKTGFGFSPRLYEFDLGSDLQSDFIGFTGFTISGRITDGPSPVVGMQVSVSTPEIDSTFTDANGFYLLSGIPAGGYTVTPIAIGYDVTPGGRQLSLGPTNASGMNFTAVPNLAVSGTVVEGSTGLADILVRLTSTNNPPLFRNATTDASGKFVFTNLPPGNVIIQPALSGLFSPTNIVLNPLNYPAPIFSANPPTLGMSRATNGVKLTLRGLPSRIYTIQTNLNGVGQWIAIGPRLTDATGNVEFIQTTILTNRSLLFRARRP